MSLNSTPNQITLKGITTDGKTFEHIFNPQEENGKLTIAKSNLKSIDLSPLKNCDNLKSIDLRKNSLVNIDLSPLHNKKKLEGLIFVSNSLSSIDLTPLQSCDNLNVLGLSENSLTSIDLSPLQSCDNFEILRLSENKLTSIDLTPLQSCANFVSLSLNNNELTSLDLTPLQSCPKLNFLRLNKNKFTALDFTPIENKVPNILILDVDKWVDTGGIVKPLFSGEEKTAFILVLISFLTSVFGFLVSLYYLLRNKKKHALMYLLTGLFSAASAFLFATSGFYTGPGGPGMSIALGVVNWIVAFVWLFIAIGNIEEISEEISEEIRKDRL